MRISYWSSNCCSSDLSISKMEAATNFLNSIQVNDCRLANRMVQIAKGDDNMSGIIEEMTGYRSVKQGFAKSYQQSREKIQANNNNPTEDLKDALENCPAEVTDIFRTGSLLSHAASRVGAADWRSEEHTSELQSLMRSSYAVFCLKKKKNNMNE